MIWIVFFGIEKKTSGLSLPEPPVVMQVPSVNPGNRIACGL
jgi:hypothetical protein